MPHGRPPLGGRDDAAAVRIDGGAWNPYDGLWVNDGKVQAAPPS